MILRIVNPNLFPDIFHQFREEEGLIQADDWTLRQSLLETFSQVLRFVPQTSRVGVVERNLGFWKWEVESAIWSFNLGAAPEWVWNSDGAL